MNAVCVVEFSCEEGIHVIDCPCGIPYILHWGRSRRQARARVAWLDMASERSLLVLLLPRVNLECLWQGHSPGLALA